jgi:trehalose-6-phosphate synthase
MMRISFRLIGFLSAFVALVVVGFTGLQVRHDLRALREEFSHRADVMSDHLSDTILPLADPPQPRALDKAVERYANRTPYIGIGVYALGGEPLALSKSLTVHADALGSLAKAAADEQQARSKEVTWEKQRIHLRFIPQTDEKGFGLLFLIAQKAGSIDARTQEIWKYGFLRLFVQAFVIALVTLFVIRWNITNPLAKAAEWMRKLRLGEVEGPAEDLPKDLFGPLAKEVTHLAHSLSTARAAAEEEAKLRQTAESIWTPERLKEHVKTKLQGKPLFVISNREPCMHTRKGKEIQPIVPASGLVTALEPVLRACGGTWIAHGAGDADREVVDKNDHVQVPPDDPQYTLRRVWLSKEEEHGYYYGFSNEGLWPLCHIAHTRPLFRAEDWAHYQAVNQKFAEVALQEIKDIPEPLILIQDYHFALLPRLIKEARPDARVALFWHIPWPNPESFGICPWQREILHGMLGADLLGFHVQFHCNNFLDTVDRALESRIDYERFAVNRQNHTTWVKPFPISVGAENGAAHTPSPSIPDKARLLKDLGVKADFMGVGVDRIDYTKGIVERFRGIESFLEKYPAYQGRFTFVELGAPSRTLIKRYHDLMAEVEAEAERINWKFKAKDWKPIVFLKKHHSHADIDPYYKSADLCLVTSLHDGMNLVAKEFVVSRTDEQGVLILSRFTGAARDLRDALLVNPYDADQVAEAIRFAVEMSSGERRERMQRMRESIREHNIYWWGASLITELAQIRLASPSPAEARPS